MSLLSIVIPAYNEEETIVELLELVRNTAVSVPREIIVVNDGSTDRTPELMANWVEGIPQDAHVSVVMVNKKNGGKGSAVRAGIEISTGDVVIIQDADMEYDPNDYQSCIAPILSGQYQVVYGSRERFTENRMHSSIAFYAGGLLVTYWMNLIFGSSMTDEPTCYKTFDGDLIRALLFEGNAFDWEPEITAKLLRLGYHIHEVPICYMPRKVSDGKKITWGDGAEALTTALKWRLRPLGKERQKLAILPAEAPKVAEFATRRKWLWGLVVLAFLLRFLVALPALQDADRLIRPDTGSYIEPALALLESGALYQSLDNPAPATLRPPGYSVFLSVCALFSQGLALASLLGCLASALVVVPIFRLGEHFASRQVGSAAAALYLLNITSLSAAPLLLPDNLFLLLSAWQCYFFVRFFYKERTLDLWLCGVFAGLASLVHGTGLMWILPATILVLLFPRKSFSKRLIGAAGLAAIFIILLAPWMTRNAQHNAGFVLDSNGNTLYYHKSAALISNVTGESAEVLRAAWRAEEVAEFASQPEATEKMRNEYRIQKAEALIAQHKLLYFGLHFRPNVLLPDLPTLAMLWGATQGASFLLLLTPLLAVVAVTYFGFACQVLLWIRQREWYLLLMMLAFVAYYLVIAGPVAMPRHQLPALPCMCTMAAIQLFKKRAT
ncbi:MAG: dolichol-phosphate mannosyltransferase [Rhodothermales bacterium]|jgi:dolichol-phosphate mannosyltransferase